MRAEAAQEGDAAEPRVFGRSARNSRSRCREAQATISQITRPCTAPLLEIGKQGRQRLVERAGMLADVSPMSVWWSRV
jgi:hypothetical protein